MTLRHWRVEEKLHPSRPQHYMQVSGHLHAPDTLPIPHERPPSTHWKGGCVGPTVGLDAVEKRMICTTWAI
jgi:hypothetical protein